MARILIHILLATMVLMNSTGFIIHHHYCQEGLKQVSLFAKVEHCFQHQTVEGIPCPFHEGMILPVAPEEAQTPAEDCCKDKVFFAKDEFEQPGTQFSVSLEVFELNTVNTPEVSFREAKPEPDYTQYQHFRPPIPVCVRLSLLQTFRC